MRWIATDRMLRARLSASSRASSSIWRTSLAMSVRASCSTRVEQGRAAVGRGHPGDALEAGELGVAGGLQLLLELLGVHLAVGDRLVAPGQLLGLGFDLGLAGRDPLLGLDQLRPPLGQIALLLGALGEQLLAGGHLGLLQLCTCLAFGVLENPLRLPLCVGDLGAAAPVLHGVSGPHAENQRERDQNSLHRVSLCAWPPPSGGRRHRIRYARPAAVAHRGVPRLAPAPHEAKVRRELIEDANRCNRPAFRQERNETTAKMPDSTWIVVERRGIGQRLAAHPGSTQWYRTTPWRRTAELPRKWRARAARPRRPSDRRVAPRTWIRCAQTSARACAASARVELLDTPVAIDHLGARRAAVGCSDTLSGAPLPDAARAQASVRTPSSADSAVDVQAEHRGDRVGVEAAPVQEGRRPAQLGRVAQVGGAAGAQRQPGPLRPRRRRSSRRRRGHRGRPASRAEIRTRSRSRP